MVLSYLYQAKGFGDHDHNLGPVARVEQETARVSDKPVAMYLLLAMGRSLFPSIDLGMVAGTGLRGLPWVLVFYGGHGRISAVTILIAGLLVILPNIPPGYILPKLIVLSLCGFTLGRRRGTSLDDVMIFTWWVLIAGAIFSVDPYLSIVGRYNDWSHGLVAWGVMTTFFLLGCQKMDSLLTLGDAAALMAGVCLVQRMTIPRAGGVLGDPVVMGCFLSMCVPIARRWLIPLLILGVWATGSRGAYIGVVIGLVSRYAAKG